MKTYIENNLEKILVGIAILAVLLWGVAAIVVYPIDQQIKIEKEKLAQMK